uniref:GST C-terminal domain-containing protein n=1 Tax=Ciona savignyi TaxID=51511 RepID=H2ZGW1_CIOSA
FRFSRKIQLKRAEDLAKVLTGTVKQVYSLLEKQLSGEEYLVGEISLADIVFLYVTHILIALAPTVLGDYPNSAILLQRIEGLPKIAAWMKKRPETMM